MKKQDLDSLSELYFGVYKNQLNEFALNQLIPKIPGVGLKPGESTRIYRQAEAERKKQEAKDRATRATAQRRDMGVKLKNGRYEVVYTKTQEAKALADRLNKEEGRDKPPKPTSPSPTPATPAKPVSSPAARPATPAKPVSSPAAARPATPAKPTGPATGMLGKTSFERRTPTSAELKAAQVARAGGANAETALQAAKKAGEMEKTSSSMWKAPVSAPVATKPAPATPSNFNTSISASFQKPLPTQQRKMQQSHYEWPSAKTIKEMAKTFYEAKKLDPVGQEDADIDNDGKKNTKTDKYLLNRRKVRSAAINAKEEVELIDERYMGFKKLKAEIASKGGVSDPAAVAASIGRKKYGKEKFQAAAAKGRKLGEEYEVFEILSSYLLENNFAETQNDANVIIENMSEDWMIEILNEYED